MLTVATDAIEAQRKNWRKKIKVMHAVFSNPFVLILMPPLLRKVQRKQTGALNMR